MTGLSVDEFLRRLGERYPTERSGTREPEGDDIERGLHRSCWTCSQPWWQIVLAQPTSDADLLVPQMHPGDVLAFCAHCCSTGYTWWTF